MQTKKGRTMGLAIAGSAVLVAGAPIALGAGGSGHAAGGRALRVVEHATTDTTTIDAAPAGDSPGDVLTFANGVFDMADAKRVGSDQGFCIRTIAGAAYECWWTTALPGGAITVEGAFYDKSDSTLAITGGTGAYRGAAGTMSLHARGTTEFVFTFHLLASR